MYHVNKIKALKQPWSLTVSLLFRSISSAEINTALRPFYFIVHPDLFGRHPKQRSVNEESLKHLSAHLEALQHYRLLTESPRELPFYIRSDGDVDRNKFKLIKISLEKTTDAKKVLKKILSSCNLSTEQVEKLKVHPKRVQDLNTDGVRYNRTPNSYSHMEYQYEEIRKAKEDKSLNTWLVSNLGVAKKRLDDLQNIRTEVTKLEKNLSLKLQLKDLKGESGWNIEHYRGCLKSLERLADIHAEHLQNLKGRTVVFASASGVSLDGHIMLFTGDVQNNWLDFIKNIPKQDAYLKHIPAYEMALSQVLRSIQVSRRKFMPKAQVVDYAAQLRKVTTALLDHLTNNSSYPKSWPESLSDYEIVIESEAGPLTVTPTGQLIAPSTCPGSILVDFITTHLDEARKKSDLYKKNKYIEKELVNKSVTTLKLTSLTKDDAITPDKMIDCLKRLLDHNVQFEEQMVLHITHYYSVLADGTICIPWNWIAKS